VSGRYCPFGNLPHPSPKTTHLDALRISHNVCGWSTFRFRQVCLFTQLRPTPMSEPLPFRTASNFFTNRLIEIFHGPLMSLWPPHHPGRLATVNRLPPIPLQNTDYYLVPILFIFNRSISPGNPPFPTSADRKRKLMS